MNGTLDQVLQHIGSEFTLESGTSAVEVNKKKGGAKESHPIKTMTMSYLPTDDKVEHCNGSLH